MPVMSRIAPLDEPAAQGNSIQDLVIRQTAALSLHKPDDLLSYFPTEIRLMIFEELLIVWPKIVFRGARDFGPLAEQEFEEEITIPWQILATCKQYYWEAMPIMYSMNRFVFCTGQGGDPGKFWRFPIQIRYMPYITDLGIYLRADVPTKEAAKRIAHFIKALARHAVNLDHLVVMISSDSLYDHTCPWDIIFCDHPVATELVSLIEAATVQHLKIRLHDNACLFPSFAQFLHHTFYKDGVPADRTLAFSRSSESTMEHMMDMQHELFEMGILPPKDDDDLEDDDEETNPGPYGGGGPMEDDYEEHRKAFDSGMLLPGEVRRYRGEVIPPAVWFFEQTKITDFYEVTN
ncbi:hypothetical protein N0V83_005290 [Neocucurbitaria cava]|uniref:Uncharacterized protein n=1 Tax=Neocucurbitaria cava TaxID=798079 RepID=A0A9W9CMS6_9PLEO|nr:hypothetical protein N0V83_005290 [Neocucurbitaria cava]